MQPTTLVNVEPVQVELAVPRTVRRKTEVPLGLERDESLMPTLSPSSLMDVIVTVTGAAAPKAQSCIVSPTLAV